MGVSAGLINQLGWGVLVTQTKLTGVRTRPPATLGEGGLWVTWPSKMGVGALFDAPPEKIYHQPGHKILWLISWMEKSSDSYCIMTVAAAFRIHRQWTASDWLVTVRPIIFYLTPSILRLIFVERLGTISTICGVNFRPIQQNSIDIWALHGKHM